MFVLQHANFNFRGKEHLKKELQKTLDEVTIKFIVGNIKVIPV